MLDTNAINRIADGRLNLAALSGFHLMLTHVQIDEISATRSSERLQELLVACETVDAEKRSTSGGVWDVSKFDEASWHMDEWYPQILARVAELDKASRKRSDPSNLIRDALIGATSVCGECVLLSADRNLIQAVRECGGRAINVDTDDLPNGPD